MSQFDIQGLRGGVWSGIYSGTHLPQRLAAVHHGRIIALARVSAAGPGQWRVDLDLPAALLTDGLQSVFLIADDGPDDQPVQPGALRLDRLAIVSGAPLAEDLRAEIEHLRAELQLLKREFRRFASRG